MNLEPLWSIAKGSRNAAGQCVRNQVHADRHSAGKPTAIPVHADRGLDVVAR